MIRILTPATPLAGLAVFSLALLGACGGGGPAASCADGCLVAPPATCDGSTQVVFQIPGVCEDGFCRFEPVRTECADGCTDGACLVVAACDPADCTEPPDDRCDGDTVLRYDAGACVDDECVYPATIEDCAASGDVCRDAQCVPPEPGLCDGVTCDDPPADRCDGDVRVEAGDGACSPADGTCSYAELRTDCADDGGFCRNGRCFATDPCTGVSCDEAPAPTCDGDTPVRYLAPGVCAPDETQPEGYSCQHVSQPGAACADGCVDGACIDPGCTIECLLPPPDQCTRDGVARRFAETGVCVEGGRCTYPVTEEDCVAAGLQCDPDTITCVADPCAGVDCSVPPGPTCEGNVVVTSSGAGSCTAGECVWPVTFADCGALFCDDGACVTRDPCTGVDCSDPAPAPSCDGDVAVTSFDPGYCAAGTCRWDEERVNCADGGGVCLDGACVFDGRCPGGCSEPPDDACVGTVARDYPDTGVCGVSNTCEYTPVDTNCRVLGLGCVAGRCVDVCATVTCDTPPAPRCDGGDAVTYAAAGECDDGVCAYEVTRTRCSALGLTCDAGECVSFDYCPTIVCETPPQAYCDGSEAVAFNPDGTCNEATDACEYAALRTNCATTGRFCFRGACQAADPCSGVSCDVAPPDTCSADTAIRSVAPGACSEGACSFDTTEYWCGLESAACLRGECVGGELCDDLDCDAEPGPTPYCDRDVRVTFAPRCRVGLCLWDLVRTNCRDTGDWCYEGECIDVDPCTFTACATPPADTCDGDLLYRYAAAGSCAYAECSYAVDVIDCAASDSFCAAGACRPNDNPCRDVVCESPGRVCADNDAIVQRLPGVCELGVCLYADDERIDCDTPPGPRCEGRTAVRWADDGTCADGACVFSETRIDCAASGRFCDAGLCVLDDPCAGVVCEAAPAAQCVGDAVVERAAGACDSGVCRYDVVSTTDCTLSGRVCSGGACVADPACDGVVCNDPPPDYCVDTFRFEHVASGDCSRGECEYAAIRFDCRGLGQVCADGVCVPPASCEGVDCSGPPPAPVCDGDEAVTFVGTGDCAQGACVYLSTRTDCGNVRGGYCEAGACANVCDGVVCDDPPEETCFGNIAATYTVPGRCDAELGCTYAIGETTDCAATGDVCRAGACVDPCEGVVCDTPPDPICFEGGVAEWVVPGTCSEGSCVWEPGVPVACDEGTFCVDGLCIEFDPCEILDCGVSPDLCDGTVVMVPEREGVCVSDGATAACDFGTLTPSVDCAETGEVCLLGACADSCEAVQCPSGVPFCVGEIAVVSTGEGTCAATGTGPVCNYETYDVVQDCAEVPGTVCSGGSCRSPCETVVCPVDGTYCVGDAVYAGSGAGTCVVEGGEPVCEYADGELLTDCTAFDAVCSGGGCVPFDFGYVISEVAPSLTGRFAGHAMFEIAAAAPSGEAVTVEVYRASAPESRYVASGVTFSSGAAVFTGAPAASVAGTMLQNARSWAGSAFVWPGSGEAVVVLVDGEEIGRITATAAFPWSTGVSMELDRDRFDERESHALPSSWCAAPREVDPTGNRYTPDAGGAICSPIALAAANVALGITEIHAGEAGGPVWVELGNPSGAPVDLSGVVLTNADGDVAILPPGPALPRARWIVLAASSPAPGFVADRTFDLPLHPTSDSITLRAGDAESVLEYSPAGPVTLSAVASTQLDTINFGGFWCPATPVWDAEGRRGTPGAANRSCLGTSLCSSASDCPSPLEVCDATGAAVMSWLAPGQCTVYGCDYGQPEFTPCEDGTTCESAECL